MPFDLNALPASLLTASGHNPKVAKGEAHGVLTAILHLAPADLSGRNVCPHKTDGCAAACLNTAGRGGIGLDADGLNTVQVARIQRTRWFQRDRAGFMARLVREIETHVRRAERHGLTPAVRLNGTSDLPWESFPITQLGTDGGSNPRVHPTLYPNVFRAFPDVQFYDYTKWPLRLRKVADLPNYSLTFSLSEHPDSEERAGDYLAAGHGVAVVFNAYVDASHGVYGALPPAYALGGIVAPVIDGDKSDLRFKDPHGVIVGLRAKGRAKTDTSGFVRAA